MSTKVIASIVGIVVAVVAGYYMFGRNSNEGVLNPAMQNGNSSGVESINPEGKKMSFDNFLKQGGSYECTVNNTVNGVDSKGTVYVDGGNVSGQFTATVSGMTMQNYFMTKDGYSYSWSNLQPNKGVKIALKQNTGGTTGTTNQNSFDASQIGDYDCKPWNPDASKFTLPSGTVFTELKVTN